MMKEDKQRKSGGVVSGSIYALKGEVVPCWDEALADEEPHDGNVLLDWAFVQGSHLEKDWKIDQDRKDIWCDFTNKKNHSYNQSKLGC